MADTTNTADALIAAGYRLHRVTVSKEILVLTKDPNGITASDAADWAEEEWTDWDMSHSPMRHVLAGSDLDAPPWCDDDLQEEGLVPAPGDPPTIRELLAAQRRAEARIDGKETP